MGRAESPRRLASPPLHCAAMPKGVYPRRRSFAQQALGPDLIELSRLERMAREFDRISAGTAWPAAEFVGWIQRGRDGSRMLSLLFPGRDAE